MTVRDLISSPRLHKILDVIEQRLRTKISLEIIDDIQRRMQVACGVIWQENRPCFLYKPENPPHDDVICHELVHIILAIEGFPGLSMPTTRRNDWLYYIGTYVTNIVYHLEVYPLCEQLRFSETEQFDIDIRKHIIPAIERADLNGHLLFSDKRTLETLCEMLAYLMGPASENAKEQLLAAFEISYPRLLAPVQALCDMCRKNIPLSPEKTLTLIKDLLSFMQFPDGSRLYSLLPLYHVQPPAPNFREEVLRQCF